VCQRRVGRGARVWAGYVLNRGRRFNSCVVGVWRAVSARGGRRALEQAIAGGRRRAAAP